MTNHIECKVIFTIAERLSTYLEKEQKWLQATLVYLTSYYSTILQNIQ